MFFVDKYAPKNKRELIFHTKIWKLLASISKDASIPHIILCGPPESGKKTILNFLLENVFDDSVKKLSPSPYTVLGSGSSSSIINIQQSNHHIVIEPTGNNSDFYLIQCVVKRFAEMRPLNVYRPKKQFKVVLVNQIDKLSSTAQFSLRRTIENYSKTCRFFMWCRSLSRVDETLRSRCFCIKIPAPTDNELAGLVAKVVTNEHMKLSLQEYNALLAKANGRVKILLWQLQLKKLKMNNLTTHEMNVNDIVKILLDNKIIKLKEIRRLMYNSIITNINGSHILKSIALELLNHVEDETIKCNILSEAARYEHRLSLGRHEITHLEGFINSVYYMLHYPKNKKTKVKKS